MNSAQEKTYKKLMAPLRKLFGRNCVISTVESNGKIQIQFALTEPKDDDLIGFPEIARMLNSDIATVRRLNGARARAKQRFPFPQPIKLGGEITRWRCYVIKDWIKQYENANEKLPVRK